MKRILVRTYNPGSRPSVGGGGIVLRRAARSLLLVTIAAIALPTFAQNPPSAPKSTETPSDKSGGQFPASFFKSHSIFTQSELRPAWEIAPGGQLTVRNGTIQFSDSDPKHAFTFPVTDLSALERRRGPEGFPVLRMKLKNRKHFDLVPAFPENPGKDNFQKTMSEAMDAMEKAIRDMAAQHGAALK